MASSSSSTSRLNFTIPEFVDHFARNDQLIIQEGAKCSVTGVNDAFSVSLIETPPTSDTIVKLLSVFLLPLARCVTIESPTEGTFNSSHTIENDLSFSFDKEVVIKTKKLQSIVAKVGDFFDAMAASARPRLKVSEQQQLILVGFSEKEIATATSPDLLVKLFKTRTSYQVKIIGTPGLECNPALATIEGRDYSGFCLEKGNGLELLCEKHKGPLPKREWTLVQFLEHFETYDTLALGSNEQFVIHSGNEVFAEKPTLAHTSNPLKKFGFIISKLLLPLGKTLSLEGNPGTTSFSFNDKIRICHTAPILVSTKREILSTTIKNLFQSMIITKKLQLEIAPGQKLKLFGFTDREFQVLQETKLVKELVEIFDSLCPPRFRLQFTYNDETKLSIHEKTQTSEGHCIIESPKGMTIVLRETSS